jgi:hypothetical protein
MKIIVESEEIMLVGYNTNISYKDRVYHIQTEDSGRDNPVIVTLLYSEGAILASKKTSYEQLMTASDFQDKVKKLMKAQHKFMIKELLSGRYTAPLGEESKETIEHGETSGIEKTVEEEGAARGEPQPLETQEAIKETAGGEERQIESRDQMINSLDDVLLNFILKRKKR